MSHFTDRLRSSRYLNDQEQIEFDNIQLTCDNMGALIGTSSRNLEQLSSFLAVQEINDPDFTYTGNKTFKTPGQALKLIKRCIHHLTNPPLAGHELNVIPNLRAVSGHSQILRDEWSKGVDISFITTKYDLSIEAIGNDVGRKVRPTKSILKLVENGNHNVTFYGLANDAPRISKLHGSVNWYFQKTVCIQHIPDRETGHDILGINSPYPPEDAIIVPPSVIKPKLDHVLHEQWQGATDAIKEADAIWFIGYSFPKSDSFMRFFLASALAKNVKIRTLAVIDPDTQVKYRCQRIFRSERLQEVFAFIPLIWGNVNFAALAQDDSFNGATNLHPERIANVDRIKKMIYYEKDR